MAGHRAEYDTVPSGRETDGDDERVLDPYWQQLQQAPGLLPASYLPPAMAGSQAGWRRAAAGLLVVLLLLVTAGGICLTYGPAELFHLLDT